MNTRHLLRLEGLAVFAASVTVFFVTEQPWWLLGALALAPDLGMLGYAVSDRVGALTYNAVHVYLGPLAAAAAWYWLGVAWLLPVALVWAAHIGADRALGYGLKGASFKQTHLSGPMGLEPAERPGSDPATAR